MRVNVAPGGARVNPAGVPTPVSPGYIALRTGRAVTWDLASEKIVSDSGAAEMLSRPMRSPWSLGAI